MKPAKLILSVLISFILITANGCWDRRELESLGFVMALGLDPGPDGKSVTTTTMIAIPPKIAGAAQSGAGGGGGAGGGNGSEAGTLVITMNAPAIYEAFNRINTVINREITLNQTLTLLIGEELARRGIRKWADTFIRFREMRRTMLVFICQGKAADFLNFEPQLEKNPAEYFSDLVRLSARSGMFPATTLNEFIAHYEGLYQENYAPVLAKYQPQEASPEAGGPSSGGGGPGEGGARDGDLPDKQGPSGATGASSAKIKGVRLAGTAVFKRDRMVGQLDNYESQAFLLLTGEFREALLTLADPRKKDYNISLRLSQAAPPRIKYLRRKTQDLFKINLKLEADLTSIQNGINYTKPRMQEYLERHIAHIIKERLEKVIKKTQEEYRSDIFGFGKKVRLTFLTSQDWEKYHWPERFSQAGFQVSVKVNIRRVGMELQPPLPR
ncbi:MAG: Ger(x)C family spore germination protein [Firmicutes bacterium]|nr:Ger(x)C family spore germination protein [Bacillota bacterium]